MPSTRPLLKSLVLVVAFGFQSAPLFAKQSFVALSRIQNNTITPRVIYIESPRFPKVEAQDLWKDLQSAAALVQRHFGVAVEEPSDIRILNIDNVYIDVVRRRPADFDDRIGDFRNGRVDWAEMREFLIDSIGKEKEPLSDQIEFTRPFLLRPLDEETVGSFSNVVMETFKFRLAHWTIAKLEDGYPVIGRVPDRPDLPVNEYSYWALMTKYGIDAEIVLTNQLVASVEYIPTPVHTAIRGGITGGSTEYNPSSRFGSSVWVSLFPFLSNDNLIIDLRNGDTYSRHEALF